MFLDTLMTHSHEMSHYYPEHEILIWNINEILKVKKDKVFGYSSIKKKFNYKKFEFL